MKRVLFFILLLSPALPLAASDFEEMFEGAELIEEAEIKSNAAAEEEFLVAEKMDWGGTLTSTFESKWSWDGDSPFGEQPETSELDIDFGASLFFDARPDEHFRVFGKADFTYPFQAEDMGIRELFSDLAVQDRLFFRVGKQTIHWGVGYFFSPADILNLEPIDPEDPEAEREGPVSLKVNLPFGLHNLYTYLIADDIDEPEQLALAPKVELVIGGLEAGFGAFYQSDLAPRGMITLSFPLRGFDVFAEGVAAYGSDKNFVQTTGIFPFVETYRRDDELILSTTAGFLYLREDWNLSLAAQYFYNGEGYEDPDLLRDNADGIQLLMASGELNQEDLYRPARHYGAVHVKWSEIRESDFSLSLFWIGNLVDGSGQITPKVSWDPLDEAGVALSVPIQYGQEGEEFSSRGSQVSLALTLTIGGGTF